MAIDHPRTPTNDWQRIETEHAARDAAARKWDAEHDPSPEFEQAARPLGPDYGTDRPRQRTPEELQQIKEEFGLDEDQVRNLRERMFAEITQRQTRWDDNETG